MFANAALLGFFVLFWFIYLENESLRQKNRRLRKQNNTLHEQFENLIDDTWKLFKEGDS